MTAKLLTALVALLLVPGQGGDGDLERTMLEIHNAERTRLGLAPLAWSEPLAEAALSYARQVAKSGVFRHSDELAQLRQGENLFKGTRDEFTYAEMAGYWLDERAVFVNNPTPDFSTTGKFGDAAHYTQMIWSTTTSIGCAVASSDEDDYLVCRYSPPGNLDATRAIPLPGDKPGKPRVRR